MYVNTCYLSIRKYVYSRYLIHNLAILNHTHVLEYAAYVVIQQNYVAS